MFLFWLPSAEDFNSHTREGVTNPIAAMVTVMGISTHTPVRV